jgi:hypothetical protein
MKTARSAGMGAIYDCATRFANLGRATLL